MSGLPEIPAPRKFQYLPGAKTPALWNLVTILLWLPLGILLFAISLSINLSNWAIVYGFLGGALGVARRSTHPRRNVLIRWLFSLIDIFNVTEIRQPWDEEKARRCFDAFCEKNDFTGKDTRFEIRTISDSVTKDQVVQKFHKLDRYPARLHHVWVLCAPSRTFIATSNNFAEYDGTSCFNLVKGFVHTYYENGDAPLVRSQEGNEELDLQLDQDDETLRKKLSAWTALKVCFQTSLRFGVCYGRWILSREVFDLLACPSPSVYVEVETLDQITNAKVTKAVTRRGGKMFAHIMTCSAQAISEKNKTKVENVVLVTQVSTQSQCYKPKVPRHVSGNWLIGLGEKTTLSKLSDRNWATAYYKNMIDHVRTFSGEASWNFINQSVFGVWGSGANANPRIVYWFNNYGLRNMHPDAGGVNYHWGSNYGIATYCLVNVATVDGSTCISLLSSVIPQDELKEAAARMKELMIETCEESWGGSTTHDLEAGSTDFNVPEK